MDSLLTRQIPKFHQRKDGVSATRQEIEDEILFLLKKPKTPSELAKYFNQTRESFSRSYIYPLRDRNLIEKVSGYNFFQLTKLKNTSDSIRKELRSDSEIFKTELFKDWLRKNHAKAEFKHQTRFGRICLGLVTENFKIHPDAINKENWQEIVTNIVDELLKVADYEIVNNEPNWNNRQAIRHAIIYGLGIKISEEEGIQLRISGKKDEPKVSDLHITPEQIEDAKKLLKKTPLEFLKFGVKTWTFARPSTIYLIELDNIEFLNQTVEFVKTKDDEKLTDEKVIEYAKFRGDKIYSYERRICHIKLFEYKTSTNFDKYILDPDFVQPLEKFCNIRNSQKKKYLFWDDNKTKFDFLNYTKILYRTVFKDNEFFKVILEKIGFQKSDFGKYFKANYGFRHFGIQMWLISTDYNYDLVSEMSHKDTATLKNWYGKRTQKDFQRKIKSVQ